MNTQRAILAAVVAVVFLFAGYNLYNYFGHQSELQEVKDQQAQERIAAKEHQRRAREEKRKQTAAERKRVQQKEERLAAERNAKQEEARKLVEKQRKEKRLAAIVLKKKKDADYLKKRIQEARTPQHIEGIPDDTITKLNSVAVRYIRDHPKEFLKQKFGPDTFGSRTHFEKLMQRNTNVLMLYAAINPDIDIFKALLDTGIDINASNEAGYTALMFASAYNTPEVVKFLIGQGANIKATATKEKINALHVASLFNPKPDVIDVLLKAGFAIDGKTKSGFTPLLLAASDNRNFEVAGRLAKQGADKGAYDNKGRTALKLIEARIRGEGDGYFRISDTLIKQISNTIAQ